MVYFDFCTILQNIRNSLTLKIMFKYIVIDSRSTQLTNFLELHVSYLPGRRCACRKLGHVFLVWFQVRFSLLRLLPRDSVKMSKKKFQMHSFEHWIAINIIDTVSAQKVSGQKVSGHKVSKSDNMCQKVSSPKFSGHPSFQ